MRLASLNPVAVGRRLSGSVGRCFASHASVLLHDALRGMGAAVHSAEGRIVSYLRGVEDRLVAAGAAREERILSAIVEVRAEMAEFRARHGFVGDPVASSPAVSSVGEPLVPRRESEGPTLEQRGNTIGILSRAASGLPPGRYHP